MKLQNIERLNLFIQVLIAASLPSSAIAGFSYWATESGSQLWGYLLATASFFAFLQPFLKLTDKIKKLDSILNGYLVLDYDMQKLVGKISNAQRYTSAHQKVFESALDRKKNVGIKEKGIKINKTLRDKCTVEVNDELPAKNFFVPKD
ncbi:hypothetical protein [Vibrio atlanticus]|uniref:SLATT domain-containing protein n=1 Tax=Vibrio atlanticus TaxID=693153 RepID=A0ABV4KUI6_9VIBR